MDNNKSNSGSAALYMVAGGAIALAFILLFTTKPGKELRDSLADLVPGRTKVERVVDATKDAGSAAVEDIKDRVDAVKKK